MKERIVRPKNCVESRGDFNVATAAGCFLFYISNLNYIIFHRDVKESVALIVVAYLIKIYSNFFMSLYNFVNQKDKKLICIYIEIKNY